MLKHRLILFALAPLLCMSGLLVVALTRPPVFYTHEEVVVYMLSQHNRRVKTITAALPWPEGVNYYAYGPGVYPYNLNVAIDLIDGQHIDGKIECRHDKLDCSLTLMALNLNQAGMPDISTGTISRWPSWVSDLIRQFGIRL